MNCKEATLLIEQKAEKPLPPILWLKLKYHQMKCKVCAYYETQSRLLAKALNQSKSKHKNEELKSLEEKILKKVLKDD